MGKITLGSVDLFDLTEIDVGPVATDADNQSTIQKKNRNINVNKKRKTCKPTSTVRREGDKKRRY
jgi:hypothetical protein